MGKKIIRLADILVANEIRTGATKAKPQGVEIIVGVKLPAFSVYRSAAQNNLGTAFEKVNFDAEIFDNTNAFDSTTNFRFTAAIAGYYILSANLIWTGAMNDNDEMRISIYKNGVGIHLGKFRSNGNIGGQCISATVYSDGDDYFEVFGANAVDGARGDLAVGATNCWFTGAFLG